ncbi:MAG TPA: glycerophosphodiester phosphodiesterase family protein [Steroidobacteraceae bacterium]|nr:glycerophosphodiester phosphodiesterase family protein [Steroidobacteraceae bacterium]
MSLTQPGIPDVVAHRGNAADYPENSLPALRSACELGVPWVEFDVQLTRDLVPVLLHDESLARTAGIARSVHEMSWQQIEELRANESARFEGRYTDVGIPKLSQAVDLLQAFPETSAFVELKRSSLRRFGPEVVVARVYEALGDLTGRFVMISFDLPAIHHARRTVNAPIGWVLSHYDTVTALKCEALTPDYLFCDYTILPADDSRLWRGPWQWVLYEIPSLAVAMQLAARGAALIETMRVRELLREIRSLRALRRDGGAAE